jgi:GGDEF domain-containing protein
MVAEKVMAQFDTPISYRDWNFKISASIGMVFYPEFALDVDEIIHVADQAMYKAKRVNKTTGAAGGTIVVFAPHELENALAKK